MNQKKSFVDANWSGLTHQQIYSQIESELEQDECEEKGHDWKTHIYCFRCGNEFQEYKHNIERKTAFALIAEDLKQLLDAMWKEKEIKGSTSNEIYSRMMDLAKDRGYWTSPNSSNKEKEKMKMRQENEEVTE